MKINFDHVSVFSKDQFYVWQSGSGFLAWWLRTIQRKTVLGSKEPQLQTVGDMKVYLYHNSN